jgi:hypothetical protein
VEGNCHFLEFRGFKMGGLNSARQHSPRPNSISLLRVAARRSERRLGGTLFAGATEHSQELGGLDGLPVGKLARIAKSVRARCQESVQQVLLYCFRGGNCGTFMPLSRVRGEFRIAVVWTRFVAAFCVISSVRFRILFTHVLSFAKVCG